MANRIRLDLLVGVSLRDAEGHALGRIEEIRAERDGDAWVVKAYVVGAYGMLSRLSAWRIGRDIVAYLPGTWRDVREIPWRDVDVSDPEHPRLLASFDASKTRRHVT